MTSKPATPRLEGLDLARYFAFVGMVIVNFKIAMGAEHDTGFLNSLTLALEGRAAATFVVLAGIGLGLGAQSGLSQTNSVTIKRALFLLALGLLNMTIFDADILHYYAFYFLFGVLLLPLRSGALMGLVIALNCTFLIMVFALDYEAGWSWLDYSYSSFWTPLGFIRNLFFNGWHPVIPWLGFLIFGIILSRLPLNRRSTQWVLMGGGMVAVVCAEFFSKLLIPGLAKVDSELWELATTMPVPPGPLYVLAGFGAASFMVGLCLSISGRLRVIGLLPIFVPAGRQTLTLYIAHILIGMGTLEALGMLGQQSVSTSVVASLLFCTCATIYAYLWSQRFRRGPIETIMRRLDNLPSSINQR